MNWTFNQNCQLVIDEIPDKGGCNHVLEVLVSEDMLVFECLFDRTDTLIFDIPEDGLYEYYILRTNRGEEDLKELCSEGVGEFLKTLSSATNSIGNLELENEIFSICHLRKCAFEHERQAIEEFLSICNKKNCNTKSSQQSVRDILLISLFVVEHLIRLGKYNEASTIIKSLDSCSNLCNSKIKKCCCNG